VPLKKEVSVKIKAVGLIAATAFIFCGVLMAETDPETAKYIKIFNDKGSPAALKQAAVKYLSGKKNKEIIPGLAKIISNIKEDKKLRAAAAHALALYGKEGAIILSAALEECFSNEDYFLGRNFWEEDKQIKKEFIAALGESKSEQAFSALGRISSFKELFPFVIDAVVNVGGEDALGYLISLSENILAENRILVVRGIVKLNTKDGMNCLKQMYEDETEESVKTEIRSLFKQEFKVDIEEYKIVKKSPRNIGK